MKPDFSKTLVCKLFKIADSSSFVKSVLESKNYRNWEGDLMNDVRSSMHD